MANALAARFRLHCMASNSTASSIWVRFLEIYPTEDEPLGKVLEPFEVCWCEGVEYPTQEAAVLDQVGSALKANTACPSAHHDLLIPVRRIGTEQAEYVAAQCRYGKVKGAGEVAQQNKARKADKVEMDNVLLQICSEAENCEQDFRDEAWKERQEKGKYALMKCKEIFSHLECLRIGL